MSVIWCMADPDSGHALPVDRTSDADQLFQELAELQGRGRGYVEIRGSDLDDVQLTVGFQGDYAVIHLFEGGDVFLLAGDGLVPADAIVEVPILGELALFAGEFVLGLDRAWCAVRDFLGSGSPEDLGEWRKL